jgi:hypothetical protein
MRNSFDSGSSVEGSRGRGKDVSEEGVEGLGTGGGEGGGEGERRSGLGRADLGDEEAEAKSGEGVGWEMKVLCV